jgi:NADH:ubiquinone oxidoreductase subunit F (NADH-binding)
MPTLLIGQGINIKRYLSSSIHSPISPAERTRSSITMAIDITVYKGSSDGHIVKGTTHHELGRHEAVVKITHSGVCGTDEHVARAGIVLGHEGVGIVTEIGPDVQSVKAGDRVGYGWVHYFCGRCEPCRTGKIFKKKIILLTSTDVR